ncbi:MAG: asparagine synthase C-terminal domain-containing protein [Betaproteobacteria bacterium]
MSGLCGWFEIGNGRSVDPRALGPMAASLARFDRSPIATASAAFGSIALALPRTSTRAAGAEGRSGHFFQTDRLLIAVWGNPGIDDAALVQVARQRGIAQAVADGYAAQGSAIVAALTGSFALAILDGARSEAVLAIDRMGTTSMAFETTALRIVFGSTLDALCAFPGSRAEVDPQAIYDYVYQHVVPAPGSIYLGRRRLSPGELLHFRTGGGETRRYWQTHFVEDARRPFGELKQEFLQVLRESVGHAASDGGAVGAFLSGGTDSSTIAGMLGQVSGAPARTYSIGFEAKGYDEMEYARLASRHFGTQHHEYYVTPDDVVLAIPLVGAAHDQPFGNSSAVPAYYCAKSASADGIDTLLGGDGGDELFGGNERYAKQYLYSLYGDLPRALREHAIEPLVFLFPESGVSGCAQRYLRNASVPMPARYENYNLLDRLGATNVFTPEFLACVDSGRPRAEMEATYRQTNAQTLINRMLALDFKYTLADNDLPKVTRSCELAGVGVRYPLLDDAMLAFAAQLPPGIKLRRTRLRYFFKEALRGFLPDAILNKPKHGFGLPFGNWLQTHPALAAIARDNLADLTRRRFVRPEFVRELTSTHLGTHSAYYGTMVWVLMMLEQWFKQHRDAQAPVATPLRSGEFADLAAVIETSAS